MEKMNLLKNVLAFAVVSLFVVDTPVVYGTHRTTEACGNKISLNVKDHGRLCNAIMEASIPLMPNNINTININTMCGNKETGKIRVGAIRDIIENNREAAVLLDGIGVGSKIEIEIAPVFSHCISVIDDNEFVDFKIPVRTKDAGHRLLLALLKHSREGSNGYHIPLERLQALVRELSIPVDLNGMKSGNCIDVRFHVD